MMFFKIVVVFLSFGNVLGGKLFVEQVIFFDKFESCKSGLLMDFVNITLGKDASRKTLINATIIMNRDLDWRAEQSVRLIRCKSKDSPDSCESFTTMKISNDCSMYTAKNQPWSTFYLNIKPPVQCPWKKGKYVVINSFFDANFIPIKVDRDSYWKVQSKSYAVPSKEEILCLYMEGGVQTKRN